MNYREITLEDLPEMVDLYLASFNAAPWNDHWTVKTAGKRLRQMIKRPSFYGLLAYDEHGLLCGLILGDEEQFYNGAQFHIREFCVDNERRRQGLGSTIYWELEQRLQKRGICEIVLYTLSHPAAEGFYQHMGFRTSVDIVFMSKKLEE